MQSFFASLTELMFRIISPAAKTLCGAGIRLHAGGLSWLEQLGSGLKSPRAVFAYCFRNKLFGMNFVLVVWMVLVSTLFWDQTCGF